MSNNNNNHMNHHHHVHNHHKANRSRDPNHFNPIVHPHPSSTSSIVIPRSQEELQRQRIQDELAYIKFLQSGQNQEMNAINASGRMHMNMNMGHSMNMGLNGNVNNAHVRSNEDTPMALLRAEKLAQQEKQRQSMNPMSTKMNMNMNAAMNASINLNQEQQHQCRR